jgi:hypothetical protein
MKDNNKCIFVSIKHDNVGKVNMEHQLDATITVLLIFKISSICFGQAFAWHYRTRSDKQHARKTCLPHQQDIIPYVVKKSQSCAPEDGQKLARNMLS